MEYYKENDASEVALCRIPETRLCGPSRLPPPGGWGRGWRAEPEQGKVGGFNLASDEAVDGPVAEKVWGKDGSSVTDTGNLFLLFDDLDNSLWSKSLDKS